MACARLHAALMARAPPSAPSRACARDLGNRARTWSLRPHSRRRFASAAAAAADHDADDAAAADARTIVPEAADAPRSPPEASAPRGAVVWFRQDLRLDDNQAFRAAVRAANRRGGEVLCLFVWSPDEEGNDEGASWAPGEASRVWLHHSLDALDRDIRRRYGGGGVRFAAGEHASAVAAAAADVNATAVFASARYEPAHVEGDARTRRALAERGIELITLPGHLLFDRDKIRIDMERERYFFGTLMPFVHAAEKFGGEPGAPSPAPPTAPIAHDGSGGAGGVSTLASLGLIPPSDAARDWSAGLRAEWDMSESGASEAWAQFKRMGLAGYEATHGRCDLTHKSSTSLLSPYLRFGQLSPRRVYSELRDARFGTAVDGVEGRRLSRTFWHRLYRREFAYWQLGVFPQLAVTSWRSHYESRGDWRWPERDPAAAEDLRRWQKGETGFPVVDAGMRRLVRTGWMHQTERMLAATFLVDYLHIHWSHGARWFHDYLVDADLAINSMMWQNAGKSGLDQWDVFAGGLAPDGSARTHDPNGETIAQYIPELAGLPPGHLRHRPWEASAKTLANAGVTIGDTYPARIVPDVDAARERMLTGVLEVRAREVAEAADAAAEHAGSRPDDRYDDSYDENGRRTDVLVDVFTGADYVVAPPGSTVAADGALLPLSTRKEFKRALAKAESGKLAAAMGAARDWALARLDVAATGAGARGARGGRGCEPSADETGFARAADIGRKRSARAAAAGHSHSHSHSHGGHSHSHSHGGHSHAPGEAIGHAHVGHTHGGGAAGRRRSGSRSQGRKTPRSTGGIEHRSSSWAKGGGSGRKAAKGLTAKEAERKKVKAGRREARELGRAWSSGLGVGDVGGSGDESSDWD